MVSYVWGVQLKAELNPQAYPVLKILRGGAGGMAAHLLLPKPQAGPTDRCFLHSQNTGNSTALQATYCSAYLSLLLEGIFSVAPLL